MPQLYGNVVNRLLTPLTTCNDLQALRDAT